MIRDPLRPINALLVLIMLASIMKAFAMDRGPDIRLDPPRSVDLSGNTLTFATPGNLSRDMPADDLVTEVDIHSDRFLNDAAGETLIRRWWDIKEPGLFGKELGTVMLSIRVSPAPENRNKRFHDKAFNLSDRFDFIAMIEEHLFWHHQEINEGLEPDEYGLPPYTYPGFTKIGEEVMIPFSGEVFNGQYWMLYSSGGPRSVLSNHYATPISDQTFIEVSFTYSPNDRVQAGRYFVDIARKTTQPIAESLFIDYAPNNAYQALTEEQWHQESVEDVMQRHQPRLTPLFGSDEPTSLRPEELKGLEGMDER